MKQSRTKWLVALVVALALCAAPLAGTPITEPEGTDGEGPAECVLTKHDLWVYNVSEMLRALGLMNVRSWFVFAHLKNGRYECTG